MELKDWMSTDGYVTYRFLCDQPLECSLRRASRQLLGYYRNAEQHRASTVGRQLKAHDLVVGRPEMLRNTTRFVSLFRKFQEYFLQYKKV